MPKVTRRKPAKSKSRQLTVRKSRALTVSKQYTVPFDYRGWSNIFIHEPYAGAWQRNDELTRESILAYHAVFACMTLIATDISKLRVKLVERDANGIWTETENPAYSPVLRKPNDFQTRNQFWEAWLLSKLQKGNTYVLKGRDQRGVVNRLWVLDPCRVKPLVADDGSVFYQLNRDDLSKTDENTVPAREIIHDRMNCLFHPLCGISPLFAAVFPATQGLRIQSGSTSFFGNAATPGGILTAPGHIDTANAERIKAAFEEKFGGENRGRIAVLGDGLKFERMTMTAEESQLIEQSKFDAELVCSTFHVPPYKIGLGPLPSYNNVQALNVEYYSQALQGHIEAAEVLLDEGLDTGTDLGTEFDLEGLLRMDSVAQADLVTKLAGGATWTPNEGRAAFGKRPIAGGDTVYKQYQDHSLAALAERDEGDDPFGTADTAAAPAPTEDDEEDQERATDELTRSLTSLVRLKLLERHVYA